MYWFGCDIGVPTTLKELMRKAIVVDAKTPVSDAIVTMDKEESETILVSKNGEIVGILTEKDVVKRVVAKNLNAKEVHVRQVMSSPVLTTTSDTDLRAACRLMTEKKIRRLPVTENGKIVGIITEREAITFLGSHFYTAYVLVKADPGQDEEIYSVIERLREVTEVALAYGAYDLIARIEFEDFEELDDFIFKKMRTIPGVRETTTILTSRT